MKRYINYITIFFCLFCSLCITSNTYAAIANGDIITIRSGNNYLSVSGSSITSTETVNTYCLWVVTISNNQYIFTNVGLTAGNKGLSSPTGNNGTYSLAATGSSFTATLDDTNEYCSTGKLYYKRSYSSYYIRYNNGWKTTTSNRNATSLTLEKWTKVTDKGGLVGSFNTNSEISFGFNDLQSVTRKYTLTYTAGKTYWKCLNPDNAKTIDLGTTSGGTTSTTEEINVYRFNAALTRQGQCSCETYDDANVKNRQLLTISSKKSTELNTWEVTITPEGSSPMELQDEDNWLDFLDNLVVSVNIRDDAAGVDSTGCRASLSVIRKSYHREVLPEFVVTTNPTSYTFTKAAGTTTVNVTCTHQHGERILHMNGSLDEYNFDQSDTHTTNTIPTKTFEANLSFSTFTAKNMSDETTAGWLTVSGPDANGDVSLSATANTTGSQRLARLVGVFDYTNPEDPTDTHYAYIEIPISQRAKDGNTVLIPNKGHTGEALVKNPHTGEKEQQVHTANTIIYYLPEEAVQLKLQEQRFRGYMRWYDYETGCNPLYNLIESDRTTWATPPKDGSTNFSDINTTYGDSYGLYRVANNKGNLGTVNTPIINGWADGKAHIMACDVSSHKDYTTGDDTIIEPTLSYRQLFHLKPAAEMAQKLCSLSQEGQYLEKYNYMVPTGQTLLLSTEYRYAKANHTSEYCYFYLKGTTPTRISSGCKWYKDGGELSSTTYGTKDYLRVDAVSTAGTTTYQLRLPKATSGLTYDLLIAEFTITYVDKSTHGPLNTENYDEDQIWSQTYIEDNYQVLEFNDFSFGAPTPNTTSITYLDKHLPWADATYGYFYDPDDFGECDRNNTTIPYLGEYALLNYMEGSGWGKGEQHGGAANGYALYVDGTEEPGLVTSIATKAEICSGQTLYCSMWLRNPRSGSNNGAVNPIFRCNMQGRNLNEDGTYSEWEDVGIFYVGEIGQDDHLGTGWQQVIFPILTEKSYDESRVSIYNFGTGDNGNDFLLDDLCLFVSPLPLAAYQATMGCTSFIGTEEASTAVIVRVDYDELNSDTQNKYVYYQIFNETDDKIVQLKTTDANGNTISAYYDEANKNSNQYGSVLIPGKGYTPTSSDKTMDNVETYITELMNDQTRYGKCYVKDATLNKWFMYIVHIVPNIEKASSTEEANYYLEKGKEYILRIASAADELANADCASTTSLYATQDTYIQLRNEEMDSLRVECLSDLCANDLYFLDVKVENAVVLSVGGEVQTIEARVHADWLLGEAFDDVYCSMNSYDTDEEAERLFAAHYGYTRTAVDQAIRDMRVNNDDNPNYRITDASQLQIWGDFNDDDKRLITDLCNRGLLILNQTTTMFYLSSGGIARYWAYPIMAYDAVEINGKKVHLIDCDAPKWVKVAAAETEYGTNISPVLNINKNQLQKLDIPTIRVVEGTNQIVIPVTELLSETKLHGSLSSTDKKTLTFNVNQNIANVLEYVQISSNGIEVVDPPTRLEVGKEHLMRMTFYDKDGYVHIGGNEDACRAGYVYFYIMAIAQTQEWTGAVSAIWGNDANWKGWDEVGNETVGHVPLPNSNVIIPALTDVSKPYPVIGLDTAFAYSMDVNFVPNACHNIYFESGATLLNQHLLSYSKAFVDMQIPATKWNSMAAPMQGMYTGDMFIPHNVSSKASVESTDPFVVSGFEGSRHSKAPYAFWQSFYNKRVTNQHENGNTSSAEATETRAFAITNSLSQPLEPGAGYQVLAFGPSNSSDEKLIVRLPKPDNQYTYYYNDGTPSNQVVAVSHSHKLAFTPNANGDMIITLQNVSTNTEFMFGNPTMAYIDMKKFLEENSLGSNYFAMSNSSWEAANIELDGKYLLAPMRSVMITANTPSTSLRVTLKASHLCDSQGNPVQTTTSASKAPARIDENAENHVMTIYAYTNRGQARCMLVDNPNANNTYVADEDALFFSSGVEAEVNSSTATSPINMYTVSARVPMMIDVRQDIDTVPLSMLIKKSHRTDTITMAFYLSIDWYKECYFWDSYTDKKVRIFDGTIVDIEMPADHEVRYYIIGPDMAPSTPTSTTSPISSNEAEQQLWATSPDAGTILVKANDVIEQVVVYDMIGRVVATAQPALLSNTITLNVPTAGVYVVEVLFRNHISKRIQTLSK